MILTTATIAEFFNADEVIVNSVCGNGAVARCALYAAQDLIKESHRMNISVEYNFVTCSKHNKSQTVSTR